jgi:hypothetical protein
MGLNLMGALRRLFHQRSMIWREDQLRMHNASGNIKATASIGEPLFQLTVFGVLVGTIVERTKPAGNIMSTVALEARALDGGEWHLFANTCASTVYTNRLVSPSIWRTIASVFGIYSQMKAPIAKDNHH